MAYLDRRLVFRPLNTNFYNDIVIISQFSRVLTSKANVAAFAVFIGSECSLLNTRHSLTFAFRSGPRSGKLKATASHWTVSVSFFSLSHRDRLTNNIRSSVCMDTSTLPKTFRDLFTTASTLSGEH